jgi:hypothetical protein
MALATSKPPDNCSPVKSPADLMPTLYASITP